MLKILLFLSVFFFFCSTVSADVIYLRNGQKVKGAIFEDTGYSYKITVDGTPKVFYRNEVDKVIKGEEPVDGQTALSIEEISEEQKNLILKFLEINGVRAGMIKTFANIVDQAPVQDRDAYASVFNVEIIMQKLIPIYAKHYNEEELKALIAFYGSPIGIKHVEITPAVMKETMEMTSKYFEEKAKVLPAAK